MYKHIKETETHAEEGVDAICFGVVVVTTVFVVAACVVTVIVSTSEGLIVS